MNYPKEMKVILISYFSCIALGSVYMGLTAALMVSMKGAHLGLQLISGFMVVQHLLGLVQPLFLKLRPRLWQLLAALNILTLAMSGLILMFCMGIIGPMTFMVAFVTIRVVSMPIGIASQNLENKLFSEAGVDLQWFHTVAGTIGSASMMVYTIVAGVISSFLGEAGMLAVALPFIILMLVAGLPSLIEFYRRRW